MDHLDALQSVIAEQDAATARLLRRLDALEAENRTLKRQAEMRAVAAPAPPPAPATSSYDPLIDRALDRLEDEEAATIERLIARKGAGAVHGHGNPHHKGKGQGGGQFTSAGGEGGGGAAGSGKPGTGKHFAERQKRKKRQKRKPGRKVAAKVKAKATSGATGRRRDSHSPNAKEKLDRLKKGKPAEYASDKARRAAEHQNKTDGEVQAYTKANEHELAKKLGGKSFPDNDAADVHVTLENGGTRGIELKTVTHGTNDKVTMKKDALARKVEFQKESGHAMYTVIEDHRDTFAGGKNKGLYSGNRIYMKMGTGSYRIGSMYPVKDYEELNRLVRMSPKELAKVDPRLKGDLRGARK